MSLKLMELGRSDLTSSSYEQEFRPHRTFSSGVAGGTVPLLKFFQTSGTVKEYWVLTPYVKIPSRCLSN